MILYWLLSGLGILSLLLIVPIRVLVDSKPKFISKISWFFFQLKLEMADSGVSVTYHLFGRQISRKKKREEKKKIAKKGKQKKKKRKITLALLKEVIAHGAFPKISRKIGYLLYHLVRSLSIKRLSWDLAINDYFIQGVLHGLILSLPRTKRIAINGNFEEYNTFSFRVHISVFKLAKAILLFLVTFPYLDSLKLYKKIKPAL
jgi:hypothetical protein